MDDLIKQRIAFIFGSILLILGILLFIFASIRLIEGVFILISMICFPIGLFLVIKGSKPRIKGIIMFAIGVLISIFSITLLVINITYIDLLIALIILLLLLWMCFFILPGLILIIKEEIGPSCIFPCIFVVIYLFWFFLIMGVGASLYRVEYREFFFQNFLPVSAFCFFITSLITGLGYITQ
ncbi:MAG: hypothetical protein EU529_10810 [Promethearchaeota archaeon]|nr:MAG: hypothetical protein EU529_10810 [Candidatus Lokiarchaeota archaeon]